MLREIRGKDGVVRGLELKLGNGYTIQRPLQLVCNLEMTYCDDGVQQAIVTDSGNCVRQPGPRRSQRIAASDARNRIQQVTQYEQEEL